MARLSLSLFGGFEARLDDGSLTGFTTDKTRALLVYLAMEMDRPHRRQVLANLFWPDAPENSARASLRHALANLRQVMKEARSPIPFILIEGETVQFNPDSDYQVDGLAFHALVLESQSEPMDLHRLEQAVSLYRGSFLEGFSLRDSPEFDTWSSIKREELQQEVQAALHRLAEEYNIMGKLDHAQKYARRQLELEPWREEAHQQIMRLMAAAGQRAAALAQYAVCRKVLADELGIEPAESTMALYDQIRAGTIPASGGTSQEAGIQAVLPSEKQRHNLPYQTTSFIGREEEIQIVSRLLEEHRLVTLTGAGGVGKTRLSIQAGSEGLERFVDGEFFIDLAPLVNPDLILQTVISAFGIHTIQENLIDALVSALCGRRVLLILDNCEHLLEACGALSENLLRTCAYVKILATSRTPLGVSGEAIYRVPSLSFPESSQKLTDENLLDFAAVRLLVERARLFKQDFAVTSQNTGAIIRICQQLDGIPFALELAAARLNVLTAEEVAGRLEDVFRLLTVGTRTALLRHQTLRATIEWSYNLLEENERLLLHRLAVFSECCTLEAVEAVCSGDGLDSGDILDLFTNLVNQSMVHATHYHGEGTRYNLLHTVRKFAQEKLSPIECETQSKRHCQYYLWLAEQAEPRLRNAERLRWTKILEREKNNIEQALEWAHAQGDSLTVIRIVNALAWRFWQPHEYTRQTVFWTQAAIKLEKNMPDLPPRLLVRLMYYDLSAENLGREFDKVIDLCHEIGSEADCELVNALSNGMDFYHNDKMAFRKYSEQCLEAARRLPPADVWYQASAYYITGLIYAVFHGEYDLACQHALESWRLFQQSGDRWMVGYKFVLGLAAVAEGDYRKGRELYREAFFIHQEVKDLWGMMCALGFLADLELKEGDPDRASYAARLFGASEAVGYWPDKTEWRKEKWDGIFPEAMKNLRRFLQPAEIDAAWTEGASMSVEEVIGLVMESR